MRADATTAASGAYPPAMPLPKIWMSGTTDSDSSADQVPVRPAPQRISSATNSTSYVEQMSRAWRQNLSGGTIAPVDDPPTGSAMNAATFSATVSAIAISRFAESYAGMRTTSTSQPLKAVL